jgi:hypothetical protein
LDQEKPPILSGVLKLDVVFLASLLRLRLSGAPLVLVKNWYANSPVSSRFRSWCVEKLNDGVQSSHLVTPMVGALMLRVGKV